MVGTDVLCVCTTTAIAVADEPDTQLSYAAPPACPQHDFFETLVRRRAPAFGRGARAQPIAVDVRSSEGGYRGVLTRGARQLRSVVAPDCTDVVDALALVAALAMEENDSTATEAPVPPPPPTPLPSWRLERAGWAVTGLGLVATTAAIAGGVVLGTGSCDDATRGFGSCPRLAGAYTLIIAGGAAVIELGAGISMIFVARARDKRARATLSPSP